MAATDQAYVRKLERGLGIRPDHVVPSSRVGSKPMARRLLEERIRVLEIVLGKISDPELAIPLDLLDRLERAIHNCHTVNLLRVEQIGQWTLLTPDDAGDEGRDS